MLKVGDKVRPVDEADVYIVTKLSEALVFAMDEHGFEHEFLPNEVVPVIAQNMLSFNLEADARHKKAADKTEKISQPHPKNLRKSYLEYDLHAGVLLGNTAGMSNHQILTEQLDFACEMLDKARRNNDQFIVFVHGKGKGRLRQELQRMLAGMEKVEFYDADFSKYNLGATEVRLL